MKGGLTSLEAILLIGQYNLYYNEMQERSSHLHLGFDLYVHMCSDMCCAKHEVQCILGEIMGELCMLMSHDIIT